MRSALAPTTTMLSPQPPARTAPAGRNGVDSVRKRRLCTAASPCGLGQHAAKVLISPARAHRMCEAAAYRGAAGVKREIGARTHTRPRGSRTVPRASKPRLEPMAGLCSRIAFNFIPVLARPGQEIGPVHAGSLMKGTCVCVRSSVTELDTAKQAKIQHCCNYPE